MIFPAIIVALLIIAIGFGLGVTVPRWVRWDRRTPTMLTIWVLAVVLAIFSAWVIA